MLFLSIQYSNNCGFDYRESTKTNSEYLRVKSHPVVCAILQK